MSDTNKSQFKKTLILILLLLLFLLVSMQAWYMFEMKQQMDELYQQQAFAQDSTQGATLASAKDSTKEAVATTVEKGKPAKVKTEKEDFAESESALNVTAELPGETPQVLQDKLPVQPESSMPDSSVQESPIQSVQPDDESVRPDNTSPFGMDDTTTMPSDLQAWNPYAEIERMQRDMDRRLNQSFNRLNNYPGYNHPDPGYPGLNHPGRNNPDFQYHFSQSMSTPEIHVKENAQQYVVFVDLPGANENDISVTLNNQRLSIKGKQDYKKQHKDVMGTVIFQEQRSGRFQRSITLSAPVSEKGMKTQLENGVLKITIPKVKDASWR